MNKLRIGILGAANIARKNWRAIYDSGNCIVSALASRDLSKASQFIDECQEKNWFESKPIAYGTYEELIHSKEVDAIYFPLPTGMRHEWVVKAARAGKHVVCEKPCASNLHELVEMTEECRRNGVQFMDGVMFMHNPRLDRMRQVLDDGVSVGEIRRIESVFTFMAPETFFDHNIRANSSLEPAGCLGDLAWYCIRFGLWAMKWKLPNEVRGNMLSSPLDVASGKPVPSVFSGELMFDGMTSLGFYSSFLTNYQNWCQVMGSKGYLRVDGFVHARSIHEPSFEVNQVEERVKICDCTGPHDDSMRMAPDTRMFRNFANQTVTGKLNEDWPMWALKTQQVVDACFQSGIEQGRAVKIE